MSCHHLLLLLLFGCGTGSGTDSDSAVDTDADTDADADSDADADTDADSDADADADADADSDTDADSDSDTDTTSTPCHPYFPAEAVGWSRQYATTHGDETHELTTPGQVVVDTDDGDFRDLTIGLHCDAQGQLIRDDIAGRSMVWVPQHIITPDWHPQHISAPAYEAYTASASGDVIVLPDEATLLAGGTWTNNYVLTLTDDQGDTVLQATITETATSWGVVSETVAAGTFDAIYVVRQRETDVGGVVVDTYEEAWYADIGLIKQVTNEVEEFSVLDQRELAAYAGF